MHLLIIYDDLVSVQFLFCLKILPAIHIKSIFVEI